MVFGKIHSVAQ